MKIWLTLVLFLGIAVVCIEGGKCGTKSKCVKLKGRCVPKSFKCDGDLQKGKNFCKNKKCSCCTPKKECGTPKICNNRGGVCQKKGAKCIGTISLAKKLCRNNGCQCCYPPPVCAPPCENGGMCIATNTCECKDGWTGPTCETPVCNPVCANGGTCTGPNKCSCTDAWTGMTCETPVCDPKCANGGTCTAPNTCSCAEGWEGPTCEIPICDPTCKNGGSCTAPNVCTCIDFWGGPTCEEVDEAKCSLSWTAEDGVTKTWGSPGYDGTTHYPEGDYCCWFNTTIPSTYDMFMVTLTMSNPAKIHETSQCVGDSMIYYSSGGTTSSLCGNIASEDWHETASYNTPLSFKFKWCSVLTDGGTDVGFEMTIVGKDLKSG